MADRPEHDDAESAPPHAMPAWARGMQLSKEQLAAAQRTRDYHVSKLQNRIQREHAAAGGASAEH